MVGKPKLFFPVQLVSLLISDYGNRPLYPHAIVCTVCVGPLQVFVRGGLHAAILDGPEHSDWSNVKHSNASTRKPCQRCNVSREDLGNSRYDFDAHLRSAEGVDADIDWAEKAPTAAECTERQRERGVVIPDLPNPLKKITMDRVLQIPFDILHADGLASTMAYKDIVLEYIHADLPPPPTPTPFTKLS